MHGVMLLLVRHRLHLRMYTKQQALADIIQWCIEYRE